MSATLREYSATWLLGIAGTVRPNTARAYEQAIRVRVLPFLGDTPLKDLSRAHLKAWFIGLLQKYKPSSAANALLTLHTMLAAAVEDELIPVNPASAIRRALRASLRNKRESQRGPMTAEQLQAFLVAARDEPLTYPGMMLLAFTGVRVGEAIGLQWEDVDFEKKALWIRRQVYPSGEVVSLKTLASERRIDLADRLANVLWGLRANRQTDEQRYKVPGSPWVLFPDLGYGFTSHMARKSLSQAVKGACQRAGLPLHFSCHSLRHTIATQLFEQGAHPKYVQRLLGHSSMAITSDRYARTARMTDSASMEAFSRTALTLGGKDE